MDILRSKLRELLAAYAHDAWAGWMKYLFSKCQVYDETTTDVHDDECFRRIGMMIPQPLVERWRRQMDTLYENLPENEKDSDRKEADNILDIIGQNVEHTLHDIEDIKSATRMNQRKLIKCFQREFMEACKQTIFDVNLENVKHAIERTLSIYNEKVGPLPFVISVEKVDAFGNVTLKFTTKDKRFVYELRDNLMK